MEQNLATQKGGEPSPLDQTGLCLLSLDGGGVRGLSTLFILKGLMTRLNHERRAANLAAVKPCEVFDLIGGTSTGGLIAIMLGRFEMDVEECISAYSDLMETVFKEKASRRSLGFLGAIKAQYDSATLERAVRKVIVSRGISEEELFDNEIDRGCKVFVCATASETTGTTRLRSYSLKGVTSISATIYKAALATSAATSYFDPVKIGARLFVDGGLGANNPVEEVEAEASDIFCSRTRELKPQAKCFISIGTGNPGKKAIEDNMIKFAKGTLVSIATETEKTADKFAARWEPQLDEKRYFRFNVHQGLQDVDLAEYKEQGRIEAATDEYLRQAEQKLSVGHCVENLRQKRNRTNTDFGPTIKKYNENYSKPRKYMVPLSLKGVPYVNRFVERDNETRQLEEYFSPSDPNAARRKVFVIYGLGGMGKTQLAIAYARKYHDQFFSIFWLDGSSKDRVKQSFVDIASRLPQSEGTASVGADETVEGVLRWLSEPLNRHWLLVFDNVDRDYPSEDDNSQAYDVRKFFPAADHGCIVITTQLASLGRLGHGLKLGKVDNEQAKAIFENNAEKSIQDADLILELLHGLPLALTQAGSYLRETNMSTSTYVKYYNMTWKDLMKKESRYPLQEYADRSILTTWTMSYMQLKSQSEEAANLLKLWAFLDHRDLFYEMIAQAPKLTNDMDVPPWLLCTAKSDLEFCDSMGLLARYSLVDAGRGEADSYSMHSVLHKWCFYLCEDSERSKFLGLATGLVASLVPSEEGEYWKLQRRLLPHANRVYQMLPTNASEQASKADTAGWQAWIFYNLGMYFAEQDRLAEAETLYVAALAWYEQTLGREHLLTLDTAASLGNLYREQGKLTRAEQLLQRALEGRKLALGDEHILVFDTLSDLGNLFNKQDRLADAETQYHLALVGKEKLLEPDDPSILRTMNNLSTLYWKQDQPERAEPLFQRALSGHETRFGLTHPNTLAIVYNLGLFYRTRAPRKAEKMYLRALEGQVHELTVAHPRTLQTLNDLVVLYKEQGRLAEAETLLRRLVAGKETTHGTAHPVTLDLVANLAVLCYRQGRFGPAEEMFERALAGFRDVLGPAHGTCVRLDKSLLRCRELMAQSK